MDAKELIEYASEDQILSILSQYGLIPLKEKQNEFWFQTLCHGGDSGKLCMYRDTKTFYCYTNCGYMSLYTLIMKLEHCDFKEALEKVQNKVIRQGFGALIGDYKKTSVEIKYLENKKNIMTRISSASIELPELDNTILPYFDNHTFYEGWYKEGISIESMEKYGISWYELEKYIIIPHYDISGRLVGIRRRSLKPEDAKNKYMPLIMGKTEYAHSLGLNLYGAYQNREAIRKHKMVCIVEGEKGVLLGDTYFGDNNFTVATCGFNISEAQIDILRQLNVERVVLGFDKDVDENICLELPPDNPQRQEYDRFCNRLYSLCNKLINQFSVSVLWDKKELLELKDCPYDRGLAVLEQLWKDKVIINGDNVI